MLSAEELGKMYPEPPTFEEFVAMWPSWDEVSKRLITSSIAADLDDLHVQTIRAYLERMGVPLESREEVKLSE